MEGGVWALLWACSATGLVKGVHQLFRSFQSTISDKTRQVEAIKKTCVESIRLTRDSLYLLEWGASIKVLSVGLFSPLIEKTIHGAWVISSAFGVEAAIRDYQKELRYSADPQHVHYVRKAMVDLAAHISTIVWAALSLLTLTGVMIHPVVSGTVLGISCLLAVASVVYNSVLSPREELSRA